MRYVIDSRYFDGSCLSSMCDDTHSDYGRETLQELCERERNPFLVAVSPGKILFLMRRYIRMLCTPFREITREDYCNLFECVPPARMGRNWFFVGEAYFGDLYPFCFTSDGRYFKGERPVHLKDEATWRMIGEHMKTLDFHPELVHGEPQVESDRWYNGDITVTPYYFLRDGKRMFIGNLISDTGQAAEDSRHRREMAERLLDLRRNHYEYCTFYSHVKDLFGFFEWIRKTGTRSKSRGRFSISTRHASMWTSWETCVNTLRPFITASIPVAFSNCSSDNSGQSNGITVGNRRKTKNRMDTIDKVRIIESDAAAKEDAAAEKVMATIFHTDGTREKVSPANGSDFRLEEMQRMVGGIIEIVYFDDNTVMVINEEGKLLGLPLNMDATVIFRAHYPDSNDYIVGDALVCSEKQIL